MNHAISILQKAAFELGGELLTEAALEAKIDSLPEIQKMANDILYGHFIAEEENEKRKRFIELLKAIQILQNL